MTETPFILTKSAFLDYLSCKYECHEQLVEIQDEDKGIVAIHIREMGQAVEHLAEQYFEDDPGWVTNTQVTYQTDRLLGRADIVLFQESTNLRLLIEIKTSTAVNYHFYTDLAFQCIAAEDCGVQFDGFYVLHINKEYVFDGVLNLKEWLKLTDVTEAVMDVIPSTKLKMEAAIQWLLGPLPQMPIDGFCHKKCDCPAFQRFFPDWQTYTVFQISGINPYSLKELLNIGITQAHLIPDDFELPERQRISVTALQTGKAIIQKDLIRTALNTLEYPLYFLDYEALQYAIPLYPGIKPYQQMVFQWSLHLLETPESNLQHYAYLSDGQSEPSAQFLAELKKCIPNEGGTVVVWSQFFEKQRNQELAVMHPPYKEFLEGINLRIFDLMEIFKKQWVVHPASWGSYSLKNVLPALAPEYAYSKMNITDGQLAYIAWYNMISGKTPRELHSKTRQDLNDYCHLDTLAMVKIYQALLEIIS